MPFYDGPDVHTFDEYFAHMAYYGRLQERSSWREEMRYAKMGHLDMPPLDPSSTTGQGELFDEDPMFEFIICKQIKNSLPGQAREMCVEMAIKEECDYCFFFDNDMLFAKETLLRLYRRQLPVVYALAFTAREPVLPVVYKWLARTNPETGITNIDSEWMEDYPRDTIFKCDAHGSGVFLTHIDVFKTIGKGWFNAQGSGEDIHFCRKCYDHEIPIYCDSTLWTAHKPNFPMFWHDQAFYDESQAIQSRVKQHKLTQKFLEKQHEATY